MAIPRGLGARWRGAGVATVQGAAGWEGGVLVWEGGSAQMVWQVGGLGLRGFYPVNTLLGIYLFVVPT